MANGLNEIATWLGSAPVALGATVNAGPLPPDPETVVAIKISGGLPSDVSFGTTSIYRDWPSYQVLCRGPKDDQNAAYALALLVRTKLTSLALPTTIEGVIYYTFKFLQPPYPLMRDANGCWVYVFNFLAQKDPS